MVGLHEQGGRKGRHFPPHLHAFKWWCDLHTVDVDVSAFIGLAGIPWMRRGCAADLMDLFVCLASFDFLQRTLLMIVRTPTDSLRMST